MNPLNRFCCSIPLLALLTTAAAAEDSVERPTTAGAIAGAAIEAGLAVFRGIPYARPPVGAGRWRPPQLVPKWQGVREATTFGAPCAQPLTPLTSIYSRGQMMVSEDCLYLNVWAPEQLPDDPLAVMVWFHGGSNRVGHGHSPTFDGSELAKLGVIVVTVNYRLGVFGFFTHPALSAESERGVSGNYALLDQMAALRWVQDNISSFGGDPSRVTMFGQSAGALDTCLLMVSPLAKGLFSRAIGQSGGCGLMGENARLAAAEERGREAAEKAGVTGTGAAALAALRTLDMDSLQRANAPAAPIVDGWVLPDTPRAILEAGRYNHMPLIVGVLADELRGFTPQATAPTDAAYREQLTELFEDRADEVAKAYADDARESTLVAMARVNTDRMFGLTARVWAAAVERGGDSVWQYYFTHVPPVYRLYIADDPTFNVPGGERGLGAYHSGELAYVFGSLDKVGHNWNRTDRRISKAVMAYWVNFAKHGDPNGKGLPAWQPYDAVNERVLVVSRRMKTRPHPAKERLDMLETLAR